MILIVLWDGRPARPVYFMLWDGRRPVYFMLWDGRRPVYFMLWDGRRPVYFMLWDGRPARPVYFPGRRDTPQDSGQAGRLPHKNHPQIVQRFTQRK